MKVVNFHDGEDDNIYVETDDMIMYHMTLDEWDNSNVPENIAHNPIAKATYILHYTDSFKCTMEDN
jgi:hypothetical protein